MATEVEPVAPKKVRGPNKIVLALVCVICTAGGAAVPWVVHGSSLFREEEGSASGKAAHAKTEAAPQTATVPFGDVVVNLNEERMSRYLRVKIVLTVDAAREKAATDELAKSRPQLKSWLISHLSGKSLKDVAGSVGVKRLQRELLEHFDEVLYPNGDGPLREVLFEEYVVQ